MQGLGKQQEQIAAMRAVTAEGLAAKLRFVLGRKSSVSGFRIETEALRGALAWIKPKPRRGRSAKGKAST